MSKLERKNHKVFGINATETKVGQFGSANATTKITTKDVEKIQALDAWEQGWEAGAVGNNRYPTQQERTGVDYEHSYQIGYMLQEGVPEWNKDTTYNKGSIVKAYNGTTLQIYVSLVDNNLNNAVTDTTKWKSGLANSDLSNLTTAGEKHFLNKSQITNCLLEVPQRIKLELNDGVLTLKAGSQVIVPNGFETDGTTPKFDYVTVNKDYVDTQWGTDTDTNIFEIYNPDPNENYIYPWKYTFSGETAPTGYSHMVWYDTKNNLVKLTSDSGASWKSGIALPLCVQNYSNGFVTSIVQVFNGMGYIGSTVWVDKGVKGLIPNGRNEDGSLNNVEFTTDKLLTLNVPDINRSDVVIFMKKNNTLLDWGRDGGYVTSYKTKPTNPSSENQRAYIESENTWYHSIEQAVWLPQDDTDYITELFAVSTGNNTITSLNPKLPFRAVDYNDKSEISGWSFPSDKYIDLTVGASGSIYIAPANGWFRPRWYPTNVGGWIICLRNNIEINVIRSSGDNKGWYEVFEFSVKKGDIITITYGASVVDYLYFYYAEGEV